MPFTRVNGPPLIESLARTRNADNRSIIANLAAAKEAEKQALTQKQRKKKLA